MDYATLSGIKAQESLWILQALTPIRTIVLAQMQQPIQYSHQTNAGNKLTVNEPLAGKRYLVVATDISCQL